MRIDCRWLAQSNSSCEQLVATLPTAAARPESPKLSLTFLLVRLQLRSTSENVANVLYNGNVPSLSAEQSSAFANFRTALLFVSLPHTPGFFCSAHNNASCELSTCVTCLRRLSNFCGAENRCFVSQSHPTFVVHRRMLALGLSPVVHFPKIILSQYGYPTASQFTFAQVYSTF